MKTVVVEAQMGDGPAPAAVRLQVKQGAGVLRSADVDPASPSASFEVDDGDYVAQAQSLVPHGTPAQAVFAVPERVTVR